MDIFKTTIFRKVHSGIDILRRKAVIAKRPELFVTPEEIGNALGEVLSEGQGGLLMLEEFAQRGGHVGVFLVLGIGGIADGFVTFLFLSIRRSAYFGTELLHEGKRT